MLSKGVILVLNSGSSSIKYKVFRLPHLELFYSGIIERIGETGSAIQDHRSGIRIIMDGLAARGIGQENLKGIGHRVVHGGEFFSGPVIIDSEVKQKISSLSLIAPLHNPPNLLGIEACEEIFPSVKQVAVFDTAFHQTLPPEAYTYPLPAVFYEKYRVRKYGFHGTSHSYVGHMAAKALKRPFSKARIITCHLGNGCSITAIKNGRSIATSMGFTPLAGLMMGTRTGDIDPAAVLFLMEKEGLSVKEMDKILNKKSGILAVSGLSNDFRVLLEARAKGNEKAGLAIEMFKRRIVHYVGGYLMIMKGADAIVFTGGIGEHVKEIRDDVASRIKSICKKSPKILVIPTNEELMIAMHTRELLKLPKR